MASLAPQIEEIQPEAVTIPEVKKFTPSVPQSIGDLIEQTAPEATPETEPGVPSPQFDIDEVVTEDVLKSSITDKTLPAEAVALLDFIAQYESRGDYNVIVGEGKAIPGAPARFEDFTDHPRVVGMRTIKGPSTAAGRYQLTARTWDDIRKTNREFKDFSPVYQDRAAWFLAQRDYKTRLGRDLLEDLRSGNYSFVKAGLSDTWTALKKTGEYAPGVPNVAPKTSKEGLYPTIKYDLAGQKRQLPVTPTLESKLDRTATSLFGEGYSFLVYSGGQESNEPGKGTGTVRHTGGKAADVYLVGPDNRVVTDRTVLSRVKKYWLDNGYGSVGTFMPGGGMHLDEWTQEALLPGMALTWEY